MKYLSVPDVAEMLGRSQKWVYLNKELIPGYFRLGGSIFFDEEELKKDLKHRAKQKPKKRVVSDRHGLTSF